MSRPDAEQESGSAPVGGVGARMDRLWTPWRMSYVGTDKPVGCIFCVKPAEGRDTENLILTRAARAYVLGHPEGD